jgi:hypothetical protein
MPQKEQMLIRREMLLEIRQRNAVMKQAIQQMARMVQVTEPTPHQTALLAMMVHMVFKGLIHGISGDTMVTIIGLGIGALTIGLLSELSMKLGDSTNQRQLNHILLTKK